MLDKMTPRYAIELTEVNIIEDIATYEQYKYLIPVVEVTDVQVGSISAPITEHDLSAYLKKASEALQQPLQEPEHQTPLGRVAKWLGKH